MITKLEKPKKKIKKERVLSYLLHSKSQSLLLLAD